MEFEAVLFDFDGLMIESERIALQVWKELVLQFGVEMDASVNQRLIGKAPAAGAAIVRDLFQLPLEVNDLQMRYWKRRTKQMCVEARPVEGLERLIEQLTAIGKRMGVASNSPTAYLVSVLKAINLHDPMQCVIGSDQVAQGKPAPDIYLEAARRLDLPPGAILVLEDSPTGVEAAIAAGMTCFAIPNPDLPGADYRQAHKQFDSIPALHTYLMSG